MSIGAIQLVLLPAIGALVVLLLPLGRQLAGQLAFLVALATAGAVAGMAYRFDTDAGFQFGTNKTWIDEVGIRLHVAVDGLSLAMIAVTALVSVCAVGYAIWEGRGRTRAYFALLLLLEAALLLLFVARDLIVFYVGFEAMLVPLYFLVGVYGGEGRRRATLQFVLYTAVGTLLMLVGFVALGVGGDQPTFDLEELGTSGSGWIFLTLVLAFAIKSPLFPFHGWVPGAYRSAPPEVAALLSGVASKAGAYGFLRLVLPLFPQPVAEHRNWLIGASLIGLGYGSLIAFRQTDSRGVIAYSSIGQMGLIGLGIFVLNDQGAAGAAFQMVNHALLSAALFLIAGWVAWRTGADPFSRLGGLARGRPVLATICLVVGVAALAVPGSSTFASEFLILLGAFADSWWVGTLASIAIVLAAMYMLRWISAILHDAEGSAVGASHPTDLADRTSAFGSLAAAAVLGAGVIAFARADAGVEVLIGAVVAAALIVAWLVRDYGFLAIASLAIAVVALSVQPDIVSGLVDPVTSALAAPAASALGVSP